MGNKVNHNIEFLTDDYGNLVGYQKRPGLEVGIATTQTDPVTGRLEIPGLLMSGSTPPNDADGAPNGAIYIQTT